MFCGDYENHPRMVDLENDIWSSKDFTIHRYYEEYTFWEWAEKEWILTQDQSETLGAILRMIRIQILHWMWEFDWLRVPKDGDEEKQCRILQWSIFNKLGNLIDHAEANTIQNLKEELSMYDFQEMLARRDKPVPFTSDFYKKKHKWQEKNGYLNFETHAEYEKKSFDPCI